MVFGSIQAGALERANVDLTEELVELITAQRNFQANAKAIETSSTLTQNHHQHPELKSPGEELLTDKLSSQRLIRFLYAL